LPARKFTVAALGAAALLVATPMSAAAKPVTVPAVTAKTFNARAFTVKTFTAKTFTAKTATTAAAPKLLTDQVILPFNLAVDRHRLLVADGATATLSRIRADGSLKKIAVEPGQGAEVAGVAISKNRRYYAYTTTVHSADEENAKGTLHIVSSSNARLTVNLAKYEANHNPDKVNTYGTNSTDPCVVAALEKASGLPAKYKGLEDSHPYSVTAYGRSSWIVADAAGNDLLKVDARGRVSTLAVLRPEPVKITKELAVELGVPACVVGTTYRFESVPTDVEVGKHGRLYVTTLHGKGLSSSVYRVKAKSGHAKRVASGFAGATNLALYRGKIYVSELFGNQISTVNHGKPKLYRTLDGALSVESGRGHLYAGTAAPDEEHSGTVVRLK
jgi:hypothetical protein